VNIHRKSIARRELLQTSFHKKKVFPSPANGIARPLYVTPGFKGQSRVHLIHAPKKTTYIITECIEINVIIIRVFIT
jgi:hypothetical protein